MHKLQFSPRLKVEFATVLAIWNSSAETRRVDALVLSWVKYEKQLRRLFSFLVFQHPKITAEVLEPVIATLAENKNLYPESFISGVKLLGVTPVPKLLGSEHSRLWKEVIRIQKYRNKLMHGQLTGLHLSSAMLEKDVCLLVEWISRLAEGAHCAFGYDGIARNTYRTAKATSQVNVLQYPFSTVADFKKWLSRLPPAAGCPKFQKHSGDANVMSASRSSCGQQTR